MMKTIGLIGGMTWESSKEYYRIINQASLKLLGNHTVKCILYSLDFGEIDELQHKGDWQKLADLIIKTAKTLENAGADFIVICTNSMHKVAEEVKANINIPLLHITDSTAEKIKEKGIKKVGLLGTRFTMEQDFYKKKLIEEHDFEIIIPEEEERQIIHDVIYKELALGKIDQKSKQKYIEIIKNLIAKGAEGIILGCTEISLLVNQEDVEIPVFDTTTIHATAAVENAIKE